MSDQGYYDPNYDPNDPYGLGGAADPFGLGFGAQGYTTQPGQQDAMLQYLLSLSKPQLTQTRSALTGVGTDLSNHVQYLGTEQPHGGFEAVTNCRQYLDLLAEGN